MAEPITDPALRGVLGSLALSQVHCNSTTSVLRAIQWHKHLDRLGVRLPFFLVHDIGLVLTASPDQIHFAPRCRSVQAGHGVSNPQAVQVGSAHYQRILSQARASETARRAQSVRLSDDLVAVLLAQLLADVAQSTASRPAYEAHDGVSSSMFEMLSEEGLATLFRAVPRQFEIDALGALAHHGLLVLTLIDALDVDTLHLLGMLGVADGGALAQVELLAALDAPEANDIVNFSLEILPSILETKPQPAAGTSPGQGYAGIGTRGDLDNLVLTELAWDDDEFMRRVANKEVLYYARDQQREEEGREHWLLIDASASMRGDRSTFARAIALATGKKLLLEGERVVYRFFDSRLYPPHGTRDGELPTAHLLSFHGERGRNPSRVLSELLTLLQMTERSSAPVLHLFTHAAFYAPRRLVNRVRQLCQIAAVFILPSGGKLDLDYLDLLNTHWVVDHAALGQSKQRAEAARGILAQVRGDFDTAESGPRAAVP
jgi:hypothetical protein